MIENKDDFLTRLQNAGHEVMMEMSPKNKVGIDNTDSGSSAGSSFGGVSLQNGKACDTELAIVTLSPTLGVIEDYKKAREAGLIHHVQKPFNNAVFDICTYIPRTRSWYYVCQLHKQGGMPEYLIGGAGYESRLVVLDDKIVFVDNRGYYIDLYSLTNHRWRSLDIQYVDTNIHPEFENGNFQANDVCFVIGKGNEKYMIVRMRLFTDMFDQATDMYFCGYILHSYGETWDCIFVTPTRILTNLLDNGGMPEMNAHISKASNEMIVTHSTLDGGWNIVFVANLNDPFPVPVTLKCEYIEDQDIFRGCYILEKEDRLLIVSNGTKKCAHEVKILYEYEFNSNVLTEVHMPGGETATIPKPYIYDDQETEYPCLCEFSTTGGQSM